MVFKNALKNRRLKNHKKLQFWNNLGSHVSPCLLPKRIKKSLRKKRGQKTAITHKKLMKTHPSGGMLMALSEARL